MPFIINHLGQSEHRVNEPKKMSDPYAAGYRPAVHVDLRQIYASEHGAEEALRNECRAAQNFYQYGIAKCQVCGLLYKRDQNGWNSISPACNCEGLRAQNIAAQWDPGGKWANAQRRSISNDAVQAHRKALATAETDAYPKPEPRGIDWSLASFILAMACIGLCLAFAVALVMS